MRIADLLAKTYRRTKTVTIDGLPSLTIHEMTAAERWALLDQIGKTPMDNPTVIGIVIKSLTAHEREATEDEIKRFAECYGHEVIDLLFEELMKFNAINKDAITEAKKN